MLGIDWIDDVKIQSILHQVSSESQGLYPQTHNAKLSSIIAQSNSSSNLLLALAAAIQ